MALANNTRFQLANRLKADIQLRQPGYSVVESTTAAGDPLLTVSNPSAVVEATMSIVQRSYNGFNIVAELSTSAAAGLPEHVVYCQMLSSLGQQSTAQYAMWAKALGTSSLQLSFNAAPSEANMTAANVAVEIGNDSRIGASGQ